MTVSAHLFALRNRPPLSRESALVARRELADAFDEAARDGGVTSLRYLAVLLGKSIATPAQLEERGPVRPLVYRMGAEAALIAAAARVGVDPSPLIRQMDEASTAEAAKSEEP